MAKGNTDKLERNDIYTAFAVLGLFILFGFYLYSSSGDAELPDAKWVVQPEAPSSYQGYPYPHDDESVERLPIEQELIALPQRSIEPVVSSSALVTPAVDETSSIKTHQFIEAEPKQSKVVMDAEAIASPKVEPAIEAPIEKSNEVVTKVNVAPLPVEAPALVSSDKVVEKVAKTPVSKPVQSKASATLNMNYISSTLPCVWVVGIFKNPSNVNRVVARLRLNKFDVATGQHEKGTYVGVPCACSEEEAKSVELREIFAAQPWLLRK